MPSACLSCSPGAASFKLAPRPVTSSSSMACLSRQGTLPALEDRPWPTTVPISLHLSHCVPCTCELLLRFYSAETSSNSCTECRLIIIYWLILYIPWSLTVVWFIRAGRSVFIFSFLPIFYPHPSHHTTLLYCDWSVVRSVVPSEDKG